MKTIMRPAMFVAAVFATASAQANDSSSAIGLGGLELRQNDVISLDSEDLFLSREKVTVKYHFTNRTAKDVETLVSFPLPAIPGGIEGYLGDQDFPDWPNLAFETKVDGKPVKLDVITRIEANGRDVSGRLKALNWPLRYWGHGSEQERDDANLIGQLARLKDAEIDAFVAEGLLRWNGAHRGEKVLGPNWNAVTYINRTQIFPAGKTIVVEHSYKPVIGGSVGGMLMKQYRKENADYLKGYCVEKAFLKGFDAAMTAQEKAAKASGEEGGGGMFVEYWLDYVLKSGANWKGPIKDFRLVVDKGKTGNLVSFCMDGVKKIGPTQFEVRKVNYEPSKDLNILIVEIHDPTGH
jgi:Domain of unknown function (DUF4424)